MLFGILLSAAVALLAMGLVHVLVERRSPVAPVPPNHRLLNLATMLAWLMLNAAVGPLLVGAVAVGANRLGGGMIVLSDHGWGLAAGAFAYVFVADAGEYGFHRLQHTVPWLWSLHTLHHSEPHINSTSGVLHHWSAMIMRTAFVALPLGLLFRAPAAVLSIYFLSTLYVHFMHANSTLDFGRLSWLLSSPSYHRIHHSVEPEHYDRNFAFIFPIYDVALGTYRRARPGELPATGLEDGDRPHDLLEVMLWPVRRRLRRWNGLITAQ
ncbi:sterol desaturase family protein [Caulobacter sp. S45]|uniref:sterol desaturase family protein n=1 Tax=Caulobacter sp. S45 TaxID=1641861 RepID=UPI0015776267|nr:sterol desaturase family protein [Caulobacter sp. S45]